MAHVPLRVPNLEQPDLAEVDVREGVGDERVQTLLVDLDVEDAGAARCDAHGLDALLRRVRHVGVDPRPVEDRADDVECRLERRARGDDVEAGGLAGLRCEGMRDVLVRVAVEGRPVGHHRARLLHALGCESPSLFMYHSLATSTYSWSTFGSAFFGLTTMAPYIPLAICASTGFVPQWYM